MRDKCEAVTLWAASTLIAQALPQASAIETSTATIAPTSPSGCGPGAGGRGGAAEMPSQACTHAATPWRSSTARPSRWPPASPESTRLRSSS